MNDYYKGYFPCANGDELRLLFDNSKDLSLFKEGLKELTDQVSKAILNKVGEVSTQCTITKSSVYSVMEEYHKDLIRITGYDVLNLFSKDNVYVVIRNANKR